MSSENQILNTILNTLKEYDGQEEVLEEVQDFIDKADTIKHLGQKWLKTSLPLSPVCGWI